MNVLEQVPDRTGSHSLIPGGNHIQSGYPLSTKDTDARGSSCQPGEPASVGQMFPPSPVFILLSVNAIFLGLSIESTWAPSSLPQGDTGAWRVVARLRL